MSWHDRMMAGCGLSFEQRHAVACLNNQNADPHELCVKKIQPTEILEDFSLSGKKRCIFLKRDMDLNKT